jgi:hypothetical protein
MTTINCFYKAGSTHVKKVTGYSDISYCAPDNYFVLDDAYFTTLTDYQVYTGSIDCLSSSTYASTMFFTNIKTFPCDSGYMAIKTPEAFLYFPELESGYFIQSGTSSTKDLEELLVTLFMFDAEVFAVVEGGLILAFLTAHYGGRIVRWLGKT